MLRLLLINPNTTPSITALVAHHVALTMAAQGATGVEVESVTATFGPRYIASEAAYAIAGHAALDAFAQCGNGCDATLLACFGDPGLFALREVSTVPVVGLAEAAMREAAALGRFSIVTGGTRWPPILMRLAESLKLDGGLRQIRTVTLSGVQIAADPDRAMDTLADACIAAARDDGIEAIILGGAGLAGLAARLAPRVPVPLIDSVAAGTRAVLAAMQLPRALPGPLDPVATDSLSPALTQLLASDKQRD